MRFVPSLAFGLAALWFPGVSTAGPQAYHLVSGASYVEGCMTGLCLCPVWAAAVFEGDFTIQEMRPADGFRVFAVTAVGWTVNPGPQGRLITGEGTFRVGPEFQSLELDLLTNGNPVHLESGLVPVGVSFPGIDVTVSIPGTECYDIQIRVVARPEEAVARRPASWGLLKSRFP